MEMQVNMTPALEPDKPIAKILIKKIVNNIFFLDELLKNKILNMIEFIPTKYQDNAFGENKVDDILF